MEIARLKAAERFITDAPEEDRDGIAKKLLEKSFGQNEAQSRFKECLPQQYKQFMRSLKVRTV